MFAKTAENVAQAKRLQDIGTAIEHARALALAAAFADLDDVATQGDRLVEQLQQRYYDLHYTLFGYGVHYLEVVR